MLPYKRIADSSQAPSISEDWLFFYTLLYLTLTYKILEHFDIIYYKMTDLEKKEFIRNFIESIELYPERKTDERIIRQINFKFPVYYDGQEGCEIRLLNEKTVEAVVLIQRKDT